MTAPTEPAVHSPPSHGAGDRRDGPRLRVVVIASWYPVTEHPLWGTFVREQVAAVARWHRDVDLHVLHFPLQTEPLTPRRPVASLRAAARFVLGPRWWSTRAGPNWHDHLVRHLEVSPRLVGPDMPLSVRDMLAAVRHIREAFGRVDVLHAHVAIPAGFIAWRIGAALGIPVLLTEHMSPFPLWRLEGRDGVIDRNLVAACRGADRMIAVSAAAAAEIERKVGVRPSVLPNGTDGSAFRPAPVPRPRPPCPVFLAVAGLNPQKGIDHLLGAFARVLAVRPTARLRIAGGGPDEGVLRALARTLGVADQVEWLGRVARERVPELFREADVFVLSSRHESLGMVVIEALASGLPVVATDCGGPRDTVTPEVGRLVPVGDEVAMAEAMLAVADAMPAPHAPSRARFEVHFADRVVADRLVEIYEALAARAPR